MPLAQGQQIKVFSADGRFRRRLPYKQISGGDGLITRYGGFGNFSVNTVIPFSGDALSSVLKGDRVEFYYQGTLRFLGWIEERLRVEGEPDTLTFTGYGLSFLVGQQLCVGRYAYAGSGVDIGSAFAEIVGDATASRNQTLPSAVGRQGLNLYDALQVSQVGTTTTFVDAYNRLLKDVLNDLVQNQAGNLAIWGGDVDAYGQNRLYLRPLAPATFPATHTILLPSKRTVAGQAEDQSGDVKNRTLMTGGQPRFPQMLHGGGFDLPVVFQTGDSGLITDGDFESQSWSLGSGASYKDGGHQEGQPFSGNWMVELDHVGESCDKSGSFGTAPAAGHSYVFSVRAKKEVGLQTADGSGYLHLSDGGNNLLLSVPLTVAPAGTAWDYFSATFPMPAGAAKWAAHFQCDHIGSYNGDTGGLLLDAVSLEDASVIYQDGWQVLTFGTASYAAVNWVYKDVAFDGLYCVYLSPRAQDQNGQDCQLVPLGAARVPVQFKQTLRLSYRYRSPLSPALGLPRMQLQLEWHRGDGSYIHTDSVTIPASAASAAWQYAEIVASAPSDAASALPIVNPRSNGDVLIDCVGIQDAEAVAAGDVPIASDGHPGYQPEGNLVAFQTAAGSGLGGAYAASEATYGSRVDIVSEGGVNTLAGLTQVADARLRNTALPLTRPTVTRIEDAAVYWPGDSVALQGAHGQALSGGQILTVVEVRLQFGDLFTCTIGIDKESPDETLEVKRLILDQLQANGPGGASAAGGAGGGYTNPTNLGGASAAGGVTLTDGTTRVSGASTISVTGAVVTADASPGTADLAITGDHKVLGDAADPSPDYLANKFESSATVGFSQDPASHRLIGTVPNASAAGPGVVETDSTSATPVVYLKSSVDALLAAKEPSLGDPASDGQVLSSTAAGVRSWVGLPAPAGFTPAAVQAPSAVSFDHADYVGATEYVTWRSTLGSSPANGSVDFYGWQTSLDGSAWAAESFTEGDVFQGPGMTSGAQYARCRAYPLTSSGSAPAPSGWVSSSPAYYSINVGAKRRISLVMPAGTSADTAPDTSNCYVLPHSSAGSPTTWKVMSALLDVEAPGSSATTVQLYSSASGNAAFGPGAAALQSPLSVSGSSIYQSSTTGFNSGSQTMASGVKLARAFTALGGAGATLFVELEEV